MNGEIKCPLDVADRKKYCLCETCLFVKQCLEDFDEKMKEISSEEILPDDTRRQRKKRKTTKK